MQDDNDRPLRLVFVGTLPEPGGAASHFISLVSAMVAAGHQVSVVANPASGIWRALEGNSRVRMYAAEFKTNFDKTAMRTLRTAIHDLGPDRVVSVFERDYWGSAWVAARCGVPLALFLHHAGMKRTNKLLLPLSRRRFILPSEDLRQWLISRGFSASTTDVLYNPIDTEHFKPNAELRDAERARLGIAPDEVLVGYIGRIESNKGILPFANAMNTAMERVPNLRALWIGFGRREAELDACIASTPNAHRHMRRGWSEEMLAYYAAMDIVVLPSTGRESFGRVLVEAQSCEIPVLGSNIGGIAETMKPGATGRLVAPGDSAAWADAITSLALDKDGRRAMGAAGRAFVRERFDSASIVKAFVKLLHATAKN